MALKARLKALLPRWLARPLMAWLDARRWRQGRRSFSQEGEDLILFRLFEQRIGVPGFYVDVGAHHPYRFSNTYFFYRLGWRGINIEPNPMASDTLRKARGRDITLQCGCGREAGTLDYHMFDEPALNTFERTVADDIASKGRYRLRETVPVPVRRLASILDEHVPPGTAIDFLSVDAEGFDLDVLAGNDWTRFRPTYVLVEILDTDLADAGSNPIVAFLQDHGYDLAGKAIHTAMFRRRD